MTIVTKRSPHTIRELVTDPSWSELTEACIVLQSIQSQDGSIPTRKKHSQASAAVDTMTRSIKTLMPHFAHDAPYLEAVISDIRAWKSAGFGVPDFYDSLSAFHPESTRIDGTPHLVVFPMYTQNGSTNRFFEALLCETIWPDFVDALESEHYSNALFIPVRFLDYTPGYDSNSAVLFPESVAVTPRVPVGAEDGAAANYRPSAGEQSSPTEKQHASEKLSHTR